jgi:hypothetical protein
MEDKLSSPSTASSASLGPLTPRARGVNGDEPYLVVKRTPPNHVYSNESFEVEIGLEIPKTASLASRSADGSIEVYASLHYEKTLRPCGPETTLITEPPLTSVPIREDPTRPPPRVRCRIKVDPNIQRDKGAAFVIQFTPRLDAEQAIKGIPSVSTNTIHAVNYKIRVTTEEDWENVWYKDEGGRDKCMEVYAGIYDKDDQLRTGEQIPLHLALCYNTEGGEAAQVSNQEILRILGTSKIAVDKSTGKARIRFRIEDVSKNHQGQDFQLEVSPEPKSKGFKDVAPGYAPSVSVRSKRNKRTRNSSGGGSIVRGASSERRPSPDPSRARGMFDAPSVHPRELPFEGADLVRLREAMQGVINWTDEVINGLYPLQWQVLGYAPNPDGSPDYSRPYHNMPNPNACITRVLSTYSDSVRENLRVLMNSLEQSNTPRVDESPYGGMTASLPREPEDRYGIVRGPMAMHAQPGIPTPLSGRRPGLHPSVASEAFRDKPESPLHYQPHPNMTPRGHQAMPSYMRPRVGPQTSMVEENEPIQMHGQVIPQRSHPRTPIEGSLPTAPVQRQTHHPFDQEESRESEVEYVLAKQYKALRTGQRLGFPAYSTNREILGFYRESTTKVGVGQFTPISRHRNDFGPLEIMQATEILEGAIAKKSEAVHYLKDWGSISNLIDHALVYDWSKDIGDDSSSPAANTSPM